MCIVFIILMCSVKTTGKGIEQFTSMEDNPKTHSNNSFESDSKPNDITETVYYPIIVDISKMVVPGPERDVLKKCLEDILEGYDESNISDPITNDTNNPFYFNYDDFLPLLKENIEKNYDILKALNAQEIIQDNDKCNISGIYPISPISTDNSDNDTRSFILKDIVLQNQLREAISQFNGSNELLNIKQEYPYRKAKYPPWHVLSNKDKVDALRLTQGDPQRYSNGVTISVITYYGLLLLVGIPGNGLSILIILTNSYMRTSPNIFLLNIALADFVTLTIGK